MGAAMVGGQRGKDLLPVMVLVGQQPDLAALLAGQGIGTAQQRVGSDRAQVAQLAAAQPQSLGENEQRPGGQGGCVSRGGAGARRLCRAGGELHPAAFPFAFRRSQQRPQPIEHFFRQLPAAEGVPDPEFRRMADEVVAQVSEPQR
jgi:hypothetical protein